LYDEGVRTYSDGRCCRKAGDCSRPRTKHGVSNQYANLTAVTVILDTIEKFWKEPSWLGVTTEWLILLSRVFYF
jgi:hypothetical protein